jgi:ApbE superfamily uncharacterized protein (UPF0280 family)
MTTAVISFAAGFLAAFALCLIAMPIQRNVKPARVRIIRHVNGGYAIKLADNKLVVGRYATVGDASRVCTRNGFEVVEVER